MELETGIKDETIVNTEEVSIERAKFGDRFFAAFVDNIILNLPLRILSVFLFPMWSNPYFGLFFIIVFQLTAIIGYFAVFAHFKNGQTLGKNWNKVKVVDLAGNNLTLGHFIVREFVARGIIIIASIFVGDYANLWLLTYLLALTQGRRTLHDIITGTQVVKVK